MGNISSSLTEHINYHNEIRFVMEEEIVGEETVDDAIQPPDIHDMDNEQVVPFIEVLSTVSMSGK